MTEKKTWFSAVERPILKLGLPNFRWSLLFKTKNQLFLTFAEKRQITETAVFGGYGGKTVAAKIDISYLFIITIKEYI